MVTRIEVGIRPEFNDALGNKTVRNCRNYLNITEISGCRTVKAYLIDAEIPEGTLTELIESAFSDPVINFYTVNSPIALSSKMLSAHDWKWCIEVGLRPGVTDNEGRVAREAIENFLERRFSSDEGVYTSVLYLLTGCISQDMAEAVASRLLSNELIERSIVISREGLKGISDAFRQKQGAFFFIPKVKGDDTGRVEEFDLNSMSDAELMELSRSRVLALNLNEMFKIRDYFNSKAVIEERKKVGLSQKITDVELEALAQTWSEHCKHKIFNAKIRYEDREKGTVEEIDSLFNTYIRGGTDRIRKEKGKRDFCLSVFKDNAGVIALNDKYGLAFKVETHNSPSALDPYGGALTGIVGVNRDPFGTGLGARLIFNTDVFCFGPPDYDKPLPKGLLHPRRIFEGVREGVEHGGNQSGIPTVNGSIVFDERYVGKPLVFCGTGGILPLNICSKRGYEKGARPGDAIVMCGGRIGKDGIHGATFSSEELHEGSPATAVQIGDAITQKKMTDFLLKARDLCLYNSITDNGAGGLSSSVGEMAEEAGGLELHLESAPLKYQGLNPWEILLSEAQERMTVAVPQEKLKEFLALSEKMGVESTVLGRFTDSGKFHCLFKGKTVAYLDLDFVHNGVPRLELKAVWNAPVCKGDDEGEVSELSVDELEDTIKAILRRYNVCSKEYVVRQYDHEVQGGSVIKPLTGAMDDGPSDASVVRFDLSSFEGISVSHGICPKFSDIDTYHMACCAVDEAVRNAISVGADPDVMAGLDNFCWCDPVQSEKTPDGHYKLAQLVRANKGLYDITTAYGVPCISGKDSMKNDAIIGGVKISIPPTLLFSLVGRLNDVRYAVTMDAKEPDDLVYIVGATFPEMGASEYCLMRGIVGSSVPRVRFDTARTRYRLINKAIRKGLIASCHDMSDGGLCVSLAETAFSGGLGMKIDLDLVPQYNVNRLDHLLFSESQSRFVVTVPLRHREAFEAIMEGDKEVVCVGAVTKEPYLELSYRGKTILRSDIWGLKQAWKSVFK